MTPLSLYGGEIKGWIEVVEVAIILLLTRMGAHNPQPRALSVGPSSNPQFEAHSYHRAYYLQYNMFVQTFESENDF